MCLCVLALCAAAGAEDRYTLEGWIKPPFAGSVSLHGATTPFSVSGSSDARGHFRFRKLLPGAYTVTVFVPGRGEARRTVEVGPGVADSRRRVRVHLDFAERNFERQALERRAVVSATQLAVSAKAVREYEKARKCLARRDVKQAVKHLEKAVAISPRFSTAWNNLGTIAYQSRKWERAEECFRKALDADPASFEPLVNLGGVLVTELKLEPALQYNLAATRARPNDALANSQLGMTYYYLGKFDLAQKYLETAKKLDPAHFSHPQLLLAEIHVRRGEKQAAVRELKDFLERHPDYPEAAKIRDAIARLGG